MMKHWSRILITVICLAVCLAGGCLCGAAAEEPEILATEETIVVTPRISDEQAEKEYLNGLFGLPVTPVEELPRLRGSVSGCQFAEGAPARSLYEALKGCDCFLNTVDPCIRRYAASFYAGGVSCVARQYAQEGCTSSPDQLEELLITLFTGKLF